MECRDFSWALLALKKGERVAREGWNGKDQWIMLTITPPTTSIEVAGERYGFAPYVQLKNAQGEMVPWQPSQGDMLAEDWMIV